MAEMVLECPHCRAERIGCNLIAQHLKVAEDYTRIWNVFLVCRNCNNGIVVELEGQSHFEEPTKFTGDPRSIGYKIDRVYPRTEQTIPEHVSVEIRQNYEEAMDSLQRQKWTSAAMMFRKILDRATKELDQSLAELNLFKRIETLVERRDLTPAMRDLATIIRLDGNEANHDEDPDEATAHQLQGFTELFLTYAFTLPKRVEQHKEKAGQSKETTSQQGTR